MSDYDSWDAPMPTEPPAGIATAPDYPHPEFVPASPERDAMNPVSDATPEDKRRKLMAAGGKYREEQYRQVAALTWATVEIRDELRIQNETAREQVEASRAHTAAVEAQTAVLAQQAELMAQQIEWTRLQAQASAAIASDNRLGLQLAFYAADRQALARAGVLTPFMEHLGITETAPVQEVPARQQTAADDFS